MCHTWGLARSPPELQGGQSRGYQGVPLQVKKHKSVLTVFLHEINLVGHVDYLNGLSGGHAHGDRDPRYCHHGS